MKVPASWLRAFVKAPADTPALAARLAACGFAVDGIDADVIDFDVTANRPDCLSVYGLAREAAAAFDLPLAAYVDGRGLPVGQTPVKVSIGDAGCGRYALAVLDVTVGQSPAWLADRLVAAGVRPINNVVDVTNYVMLELGHPMHAFDTDKLAGPEIRVRRARGGETLVTLDGQKRTLDDTMLVIADREQAIAVAGIIGGATSEVSVSTKRIALESAWFLPASVRATSKRLGVKTEASARFERGADIQAVTAALERAIDLLTQLGASGRPTVIADVFPRPTSPQALVLRRERLARVLGRAIEDRDVERVLPKLGFSLTAVAGGWSADVPSYRVDVSREIDLIEEVGRHTGLDLVPATFPALSNVPRVSAPAVGRARLLRRLLLGAGLQEAVTFTFIEHTAAAPYADEADRVVLANPLSEKFAVMRPSLAAGLLESLVYNRNRQATDIRLFEIGAVFSKRNGEHQAAGFVLTGQHPSHWSRRPESVGFTDAKGVIELIAQGLGVPVTFAPVSDEPWLVRGQAATVWLGATLAGWVGRLSAAPSDDDPVFAGELDLDVVARAVIDGPRPVTVLPRFPTVVRDVSILVDERLPAEKVRGTIRSNAPAWLVGMREFDRYQGKGVPEGRVSLSIRLTFQHHDRTLTDADVQPAMDAIVRALEQELQAVLRGR